LHWRFAVAPAPPLRGLERGQRLGQLDDVGDLDRAMRFALGADKRSEADRERRQAMTTLIRLGWGLDNPMFRQMFASMFIPEGTKEQSGWWSELQRNTTSSECAARYHATVADLDVRDLLPKVTTPTLVMHVRGDLVAPFELGRQMAAGIPGARFIALPGKNHIFLEHEPGCDRFFEEIKLFLNK
jgi:pimeloyl-ACP methyl ester carboxylesterase